MRKNPYLSFEVEAPTQETPYENEQGDVAQLRSQVQRLQDEVNGLKSSVSKQAQVQAKDRSQAKAEAQKAKEEARA